MANSALAFCMAVFVACSSVACTVESALYFGVYGTLNGAPPEVDRDTLNAGDSVEVDLAACRKLSRVEEGGELAIAFSEGTVLPSLAATVWPRSLRELDEVPCCRLLLG